MRFTIGDIAIPDSQLAREITELVRDTESPLLFHHSSRVYYWAALAGHHRGLGFDPELLYAGAMFHDMGLTPAHGSPDKRFEVDGANAAADFLRSRGIGEREVEKVWTAIALHTTPGIPEFMAPEIALVTAGATDERLRELAVSWSDRVVELLTPIVGRQRAVAIDNYLDGVTMHAAVNDQPIPETQLAQAIRALMTMPITHPETDEEN